MNDFVNEVAAALEANARLGTLSPRRFNIWLNAAAQSRCAPFDPLMSRDEFDSLLKDYPVLSDWSGLRNRLIAVYRP